MNFLHSHVRVADGQAVVVRLDHAANVKVMDAANVGRYRNGESHTYYGGHATRSPVVIRPPQVGAWHVTVDLGGDTGSIRASIGVS
jgi:hypothetical protein